MWLIKLNILVLLVLTTETCSRPVWYRRDVIYHKQIRYPDLVDSGTRNGPIESSVNSGDMEKLAAKRKELYENELNRHLSSHVRPSRFRGFKQSTSTESSESVYFKHLLTPTTKTPIAHKTQEVKKAALPLLSNDHDILISDGQIIYLPKKIREEPKSLLKKSQFDLGLKLTDWNEVSSMLSGNSTLTVKPMNFQTQSTRLAYPNLHLSSDSLNDVTGNYETTEGSMNLKSSELLNIHAIHNPHLKTNVVRINDGLTETISSTNITNNLMEANIRMSTVHLDIFENSKTSVSVGTPDGDSPTTTASVGTPDSEDSTTLASADIPDEDSSTTTASVGTPDSEDSTTLASAGIPDEDSSTTAASFVGTTDDKDSSTTADSFVGTTDDEGSSTTADSFVGTTDDEGSSTTADSFVGTTDDEGSSTTAASFVGISDEDSSTTASSVVGISDDEASSTTAASVVGISDYEDSSTTAASVVGISDDEDSSTTATSVVGISDDEASSTTTASIDMSEDSSTALSIGITEYFQSNSSEETESTTENSVFYQYSTIRSSPFLESTTDLAYTTNSNTVTDSPVVGANNTDVGSDPVIVRNQRHVPLHGADCSVDENYFE